MRKRRLSKGEFISLKLCSLQICPRHRGNVIDKWTHKELFDAYERLYTPGTKTGAFYHKDIYIIAIREQLNRIEPPKLLPDRFMLEMRSLWFHAHHPFHEIIDKKIQQLHEAGLIEYFMEKYYENESRKYGRNFGHAEPFKVLTLEELEAGFVVSLIPLVVSALVFCIECITKIKFSRFFRKV